MQCTAIYKDMSTKKSNKEEYWKWKPVGEKSLDATVTLRLTSEQKTKLKATPHWQEQLRGYIDKLIDKSGE
ncbi:MAG: hypothetical protein WBA41_08335 [Rivularia sp. (in: cyanobacteria)]